MTVQSQYRISRTGTRRYRTVQVSLGFPGNGKKRYKTVQVSTGFPVQVQGGTGLYKSVQEFHLLYIPVHTSMYWYLKVYTGMYLYVQVQTCTTQYTSFDHAPSALLFGAYESQQIAWLLPLASLTVFFLVAVSSTVRPHRRGLHLQVRGMKNG